VLKFNPIELASSDKKTRSENDFRVLTNIVAKTEVPLPNLGTQATTDNNYLAKSIRFLLYQGILHV
jgi:hypothetical protein